MARPQFGAQVDAGPVEAGGMLSLDHPHGHATWQAIGAFAVIAFILGRGRGLVGAAASALVFIGLVVLAQIVGGYLVHSWTLNHPEHPAAFGLEFNMTGA